MTIYNAINTDMTANFEHTYFYKCTCTRSVVRKGHNVTLISNFSVCFLSYLDFGVAQYLCMNNCPHYSASLHHLN